MNDKYIQKYGIVAIVAFIVACLVWASYFRTDDTSTDRSLERIREQQQQSIGHTQSIGHSIDRSTEYNQLATIRTNQIERHLEETGRRIEESRSGNSEATKLLERNEQLFKSVHKGSQETANTP